MAANPMKNIVIWPLLDLKSGVTTSYPALPLDTMGLLFKYILKLILLIQVKNLGNATITKYSPPEAPREGEIWKK